MTGNADEPPKPAPPIDAQREQMVDALTSTERNLLLLAQSASMLISGLAGGKPDAVNPAVAQHQTRLDQRRQALLAMPHEQLRAMYQQQLATDREHQRQAVEAKAAKRQKQADAKEAARFYNQASASADFDFWTKHEYWTFEEALALLLGKNPEVVTAARVRRELADAAMIVNSGDPIPQFLQVYERLRKLAERATPMAGAKLKPAAVVAWAQSAGVRVPDGLTRLLSTSAAEPRDAPVAKPSEPDGPAVGAQHETSKHEAQLKKVALVRKYAGVWATVESDLAHASENGLSRVAKAAAHGMWREVAALEWARQNGKIIEAARTAPTLLSGLPGRVHRLEDD
jgi:hypothetical protein